MASHLVSTVRGGRLVMFLLHRDTKETVQVWAGAVLEVMGTGKRSNHPPLSSHLLTLYYDLQICQGILRRLCPMLSRLRTRLACRPG